MPYQIPSWDEFQQYKDRRPPWIRFHRSLLDNRKFQSLPLSARAMLPMLWLLATENKDYMSGIVDLLDEDICYRLRISQSELSKNIEILVSSCFITDVHNDTEFRENVPRAETETETETDGGALLLEKLWKIWMPYEMVKGNKKSALKSLIKVLANRAPIESIISAAIEYCEQCHRTKTKTQHISTWLNQGGYEMERENEEENDAAYLKAKKMIEQGSVDPGLKSFVESYEARQ